MSKNLIKNVIKNVEDIKLSINCFLVNILEDESNLVLDNQEKDEVVVFNSDVNWKWSNQNGLVIHIWDKENTISIPVNQISEDEESFDRLYTKDYMFTIL